MAIMAVVEALRVVVVLRRDPIEPGVTVFRSVGQAGLG